MSNEDIIKRTGQWEDDWKNSPKKQTVEKQIEENENTGSVNNTQVR